MARCKCGKGLLAADRDKGKCSRCGEKILVDVKVVHQIREAHKDNIITACGKDIKKIKGRQPDNVTIWSCDLTCLACGADKLICQNCHEGKHKACTPKTTRYCRCLQEQHRKVFG